MVLPNLIHPVPIQIQQIRRTATLVDPDFREEVETVSRDPTVTCPGQVKWRSDDKLRPTKVGSDSGSVGYVLFRRVDLRNRGITSLNQGDRMIFIGSGANIVPTDNYIVDLEYIAGYSDRSGPTLVKAHFKDRHPAKQTKGA